MEPRAPYRLHATSLKLIAHKNQDNFPTAGKCSDIKFDLESSTNLRLTHLESSATNKKCNPTEKTRKRHRVSSTTNCMFSMQVPTENIYEKNTWTQNSASDSVDTTANSQRP